MAGIGPAPKPKEQRRNKSAPRRGEWVDLPPLEGPVLPPLEGEFSEETVELWDSWRGDPVTAQWTSSDVGYAVQTIRLIERRPHAANEARLRMDALGLTPKGKRDLRWRVGEAEVVPTSSLRQQKRARQRRAKLHVVA